jgi:hypothetical protein
MQIVKFVSGDFAMSESYNGTTSLAQAESDINILVANPSTAVGYAIGLRIGTIDANNTAGIAPSNPTGSQTTLLAQFPGVTLIGEIFNYLQSKLPGFHLHVFFWSETYGGTFSAAAITSSSLNNGGASGGGFYIPNYIWNCGGTVHVPSSYLSSTTTAYAVAPIYSGSSQYGLQFDGYNGTNLTSCGWQIWNPGLTQALINTEQAVFSVYQFTVTSGPLSGNTYTVDTCPLTHYGDLEEVSYSHANNPSGLPAPANPPLSAAGGLYPPSIANFVTGYKARLEGRQTNTPHTMFNDCVTFGYGASGQGAQTQAQVAAMVNNNISGVGLSTIPNLAMACADTFALNWYPPSQGPVANEAMQGFVGITSPVSIGTALPASSVPTLTGVQDYWAIYEPYDYGAYLPSGTASYSQAGVVAMAAGANNGHVAATRRFWCMGDNSTFGTTAWTTYVSQALPNCVACSSLLPTNVMAAPENFVAASTTASSVTLTWSPQTTNTGTELVYKIYRNGSLINTTANTSVSTYTDTGLPANTEFTYTINLANANGTGPQATWVATTAVYSYPNFSGSTTGITLSSNANSISGGQLFIANGAPGAHEAGGAMYTAQQNISGGFTSHFNFVCPAVPVSAGTTPVINGMTFTIQNVVNNGNPFGLYGAKFSADANMAGYGWYASPVTGQYNSLTSIGIALIWSGQNHNAIDYKNGGQPSTVGLYLNGGNQGVLAPEQDMVPFGINLYSGHTFQATVVYDSTNLAITFVLQDTTTLAQARFTWPLNLPLVLGGNTAWVGFTAGTAGSTVITTAINSWDFSTGINARLSAPAFSVPGGSYSSSQTVSINASAGASIYYTTNGLPPTSASTLYSGPITVSANQLIQAIAVQSGYTDSFVASANYLISASNTINFGSGFASASSLIIPVGNAQFSGSVIDLTVAGTSNPQSIYSLTGAAWYAAPVTVSSFSTTFDLVFPTSNANGIVFVIQNQNAAGTDGTALAVTGGPFGLGGGLAGFGYSQPTGEGITVYGFLNSVGLSFNAGDNGVGVYTNGSLPSGSDTTISGITLTSGHTIQVTLTYSGTTLGVTLKDLTTLATFSHNFTGLNIPTIVGASTAYVGFTASTGYSPNWGTQSVNSWTM